MTEDLEKINDSACENAAHQAAAGYAKRGWCVIPIHSIVNQACTCRLKAKCRRPGKHPRCRRGVNDATSDPAVIHHWFAKWPNANVGIATGAASGFDVVDVDPRHRGDESLRDLEGKWGALPATVVSITGGLGNHYFFSHDPRARIGNAQSIMPGIDIKTSGGYIVAPPSLHFLGGKYCWEGASHPDEVEIAQWPPWLRSLVGTRAPSPDLGRQPTARIKVGARNLTLTSGAGEMRRIGMDAPEIEAALQVRNQQRCVEPLPREEVNQIAKSVARYPPYESNLKAQRGRFAPVGYRSAESAIFDLLRFGPNLGASQFLMLAFHAERSLAFNKRSDTTAKSQFVDGVYSERLARWIRAGCGLQAAAALNANRALANRNPPLLLVTRHRSLEKGYEATEYELSWPAFSAYVAERKQRPRALLVHQIDKPLIHQKDIQYQSFSQPPPERRIREAHSERCHTTGLIVLGGSGSRHWVLRVNVGPLWPRNGPFLEPYGRYSVI